MCLLHLSVCRTRSHARGPFPFQLTAVQTWAVTTIPALRIMAALLLKSSEFRVRRPQQTHSALVSFDTKTEPLHLQESTVWFLFLCDSHVGDLGNVFVSPNGTSLGTIDKDMNKNVRLHTPANAGADPFGSVVMRSVVVRNRKMLSAYVFAIDQKEGRMNWNRKRLPFSSHLQFSLPVPFSCTRGRTTSA